MSETGRVCSDEGCAIVMAGPHWHPLGRAAEPVAGRVPPPKRPRWRLWLARRIYPWWTDDEVDALRWRAHVRAHELAPYFEDAPASTQTN